MCFLFLLFSLLTNYTAKVRYFFYIYDSNIIIYIVNIAYI